MNNGLGGFRPREMSCPPPFPRIRISPIVVTLGSKRLPMLYSIFEFGGLKPGSFRRCPGEAVKEIGRGLHLFFMWCLYCGPFLPEPHSIGKSSALEYYNCLGVGEFEFARVIKLS